MNIITTELSLHASACVVPFVGGGRCVPANCTAVAGTPPGSGDRGRGRGEGAEPWLPPLKRRLARVLRPPDQDRRVGGENVMIVLLFLFVWIFRFGLTYSSGRQ